MIGNCDRCVYWAWFGRRQKREKAQYGPKGEQIGASSPEYIKLGECRRNPPGLVIQGVNVIPTVAPKNTKIITDNPEFVHDGGYAVQTSYTTAHPMTLADNGCGDFLDDKDPS